MLKRSRRHKRDIIQRAKQMKVHTVSVIGKCEVNTDAVSIRVHGKGNLGAKPRAEVIADLLQTVAARSA
jgi:threonyl-tRNA synthetase